MYESYFGLTERPFSIAPDPQYLYMSSRHREAMAHLSYGLSQGGCFIVLTGEVGTGKTTLCRNLLGELPDNVDVALILNANINERELLQTICDELRIPHTPDITQKQLLDLINQYLLNTFAQNRHTVLIIDEAQLLSRDVLEQIRLLTNLETTKAKLLQIILIGQPELNDLLSRNDLRQLAQRVTARYHLGALRRIEIEEYVNYRLGVAGCKQPLFSKQALAKMHTLTDGIPRKINVLADHALLAAYAKTQTMVDAKTVKTAANDVFFDNAPPGTDKSARIRHARWWLLATAAILANVGLWWFFTQSSVPAIVAAPNIETKVASDSRSGLPEAMVVTSGGDQLTEKLDGLITDIAPTDSSALAAGQGESVDSTEATLKVTGSNTRTPGTVMVAEEFLDASSELPPGIEQTMNSSSVAASVDTDSDPALVTVARGTATQTSIESDSASPAKVVFEEIDFGQLLETSADVTGRIAAFRNLAEIWQVSLPEQMLEPACLALNQQGLRCLGFSDWSKLLLYNRPAIIVVGHRDQLHRVIVRSIDGDRAEVMVGSKVYRIALNELRSRWTGSGVLVWRLSQAGNELRQFGQRSPDIIWTRGYLNRALNQARMPLLESVDLPEFDLDMSQKVFALQTRYGIAGDSKIGPETYLLMNELVNPVSTPILRKRLR